MLLNIPVEKIKMFDEIDSIDEAAEKLDKSQEPIEGYTPRIPPEVEFWGHCSNLQVWHEHNYDTRLLHSNLAFPLLRRLTEVGDLQAKRVFKKEIAKRLERGYMPVIKYLMQEGFFNYLNHEELITALLEPDEANAILELEAIIDEKFEILLDDPDYSMQTQNLNITVKNRHVITLKTDECDFEKVEPILKILKEIRYLEIYFKNVKTFPKSILSYKNLKFLVIDGLEIDELPKEICNMKFLYRLYFCDCIIRKIPKCMINLKDLNTIEIYDDFLDDESKNILKEIKSKIKKNKNR
ncbi:MAG: leucine-rich repeat domain-containing protein [Promethearchaeia archaeon]